MNYFKFRLKDIFNLKYILYIGLIIQTKEIINKNYNNNFSIYNGIEIIQKRF